MSGSILPLRCFICRIIIICFVLQAFETSLAELKPQISAVLAQGKQLKDNCSSIDTPAISDQLDQLNTAWSQLYSDGFGRKHQLEDALLQLGQFHDALAELLTWLADSMNTLREAPPPGVKPESVELQLQELKVKRMCIFFINPRLPHEQSL